MAKIQMISVSTETGVRKDNVDTAVFRVEHGIDGDAHAGKWHRQVSLLAKESIGRMVDAGLDVDSGDFAENLTTEGIDLTTLPTGTRMKIGDDIEFVVSQLGKVCHHKCAIYHMAGDCVMPREGIFAVVKKGGEMKVGDPIETFSKDGFTAAVITLSDKACKGEREDTTGPAVAAMIREHVDPLFIRMDVIPDEPEVLERTLIDLCDMQKIDLIVTNGSTGIAPRDIAPETTEKVITRRLPGFEEAMRMNSFKITPHALISRAVAGTRGNSLIINVPGSPKGATENLEVVMPAIVHTIKKLQGDPDDCAR